MQLSPEQLKTNIQFIAKQIGFDDCRFSVATTSPHSARFYEWLAEGTAGDMKWLERDPQRRVDPREILPGAATVISLALNYNPGKHPQNDYRIAKYSFNQDYHDIVDDMLKDLNEALIEMGGQQRYYVDTGPILERDFATASGLGWNGKSTVQIHPKLGTWFFLCELITTLAIPSDKIHHDRCGKCTSCIQACPTNAITAPRKMDARKCISYLTIEHHGSIPEELRPLMGDRIYGCDDCLSACPWNKFASLARETKFHAKQEIFKYSLRDFLSFNEAQFRHVFAKSPIKRIKLNKFLRNVCVAIGNTGNANDITILEETSRRHDPLVKEHAQWAIRQIKAQDRSQKRSQ